MCSFQAGPDSSATSCVQGGRQGRQSRTGQSERDAGAVRRAWQRVIRDAAGTEEAEQPLPGSPALREKAGGRRILSFAPACMYV